MALLYKEEWGEHRKECKKYSPHINCPEAYIGELGRALGEEGSKNTSRPPLQITSTAIPQDIY